jgi:calcineurin-like phosphoesterase family protein
MFYFTSDTHFSSPRTLELSKRPFNSVREMDRTIISNWNNTVGEEDIVYHLGDFGDYNLRKYLNGSIVLLLGNYEHDDIRTGKIKHIVEFKDYGFDSVSKLSNISVQLFEYMDFIDDTYKKDLPESLFLSHEPENCVDINNSRFDKHSIFNLFGHIHKLQMVKRYGLNVGVDCHNFTPIDINTVLFYRNGILNHYDNNVFD